MQFRYTFIYVQNIEMTVAFYEKAFGFKLRFMPESKLYAELDTGDTRLAFVSEKMAEKHAMKIYKNTLDKPVGGFQIGFVSDDVQASYEKALAAGCTNVAPPTVTPWGQTVAMVRDLNGVWVEIASHLEY